MSKISYNLFSYSGFFYVKLHVEMHQCSCIVTHLLPSLELQAPSPEHVRCDKIQMFQILYSAENDQFWTEIFARSSDSNKTIRNLRSDTVYRVKVAAINNRDLMGTSEEVRMRTSMAGTLRLKIFPNLVTDLHKYCFRFS